MSAHRQPPAQPAPARPPHARGERGSIGLWLLGVCVMLLFLGGVSLDLWRAFTERRGLAAAADAAAVAAAQGLDAEHFRATGEIALDPRLAEALARESLAAQPEATALTGVAVDVEPDRATVTVTGEVGLTLLAVLAGDQGPLAIAVSSSAAPHEPPEP